MLLGVNRMKRFFAFTLLCASLYLPPAAFSQISEDEILALIAADDLVLARERVSEARRQSPNSAMAAYYGALLEEDADAAASAFLDFVSRFGSSEYHERALYRLGQYYFARGVYQRSRQYFVESANAPANSSLAGAARYYAAKALLVSGDLLGAKFELQNVAREFAGTWMADFAQEDLAQYALKSLPANQPPPRLEEKIAAPKIAPPAAPRKEERTVENQTKTPASAKKEERKPEPVVPKKSEAKSQPAAIYAVQVGAFLQRQNAEDQKKRYAQAGYKTEVVEKQEGRRKYYAVWVGELQTREQAFALVDELKKKFKVRAHTVRRDE